MLEVYCSGLTVPNHAVIDLPRRIVLFQDQPTPSQLGKRRCEMCDLPLPRHQSLLSLALCEDILKSHSS
jgi:hypothetical protein